MTDAETSEELMVACELDAAPDKVWRALTVPEFVAAWLLPNDMGETHPGAQFSLEGTAHGLSPRIEIEVLDSQPQRRLRMSWREAGAEESVVTFELRPSEAGGTLLRVHHGPLALPLRAANANATVLALAA
jgi:uncharacterized protein YndB with AHSA1/START domain